MPRQNPVGTRSKRRAAARSVAVLTGLLVVATAQAEPPGGGERHGGPGGGGRGFGAPHAESHGFGFAGPRAESRGFAGPRFEGRGPGDAGRAEGRLGAGFAGHDPGRFTGYRGGVARGQFGQADWVRAGWHGRGPFLAYAGGRESWDWRGAWGGGFWGPSFGRGWGGWAWGGIALGVGIGFIVAPPVYILPPPIYAEPPPVVLGLPAIEPPPLVEAAPTLAQAAPPPPAAQAPSTADMVAASVPPPIVVSPPPYVVADAPPPPVIFAPPDFAFAIAPPVLAFTLIGPAFYSGGFFTGGTIARGYYGAAWDRPYWHSSIHYERPGFFARVGARVGLGGAFGYERHGYERVDRFYGPQGGRMGGGGSRGNGGFHVGGRFGPGGGEGHRGGERGRV